jgi:uncharacterized protein (DUF983 family)
MSILRHLVRQARAVAKDPAREAAGLPDDESKNTLADRSSGILRVKCPHCGTLNEFPGFNQVDVFICSRCGEPVEVKEPQE